MTSLNSFKGWQVVNFGFRPGIQASLHLRNFSNVSGGIESKRLATLLFSRSARIELRNIAYDDAIIVELQRTASGNLSEFRIVLTAGEIVVEADDLVSVTY